MQKCVTFSMGQFAVLLERLLGTPEGAGSLLDNCGILGFTECTEGRSHNAMSQPGIPMIVAGRAGGNLVHPGIHYKSPGQGDKPSETNGRNVSVVPKLIFDHRFFGGLRLGANAGVAIRESTSFANINAGSEFVYAGALGYRFGDGDSMLSGLEIQLNATNLFDKTYVQNSISQPRAGLPFAFVVPEVYLGEGRRMGVTLTAKY